MNPFARRSFLKMFAAGAAFTAAQSPEIQATSPTERRPGR